MKELILTLVLSAAFMTACSSYDDFPEIKQPTNESVSPDYRIDVNEAQEIAKRVLERSMSTRSEEAPEIGIIMNTQKTRTEPNLPDTLAYILNYPQNSGFTVISTDRRLYPVLAYSTEGNFKGEVDAVKEYFLSRLPFYMRDKIAESKGYTYNVEDDYDVSCVSITPTGDFGISQWDPYNKYINIEYPEYPAGCLTVACALLATHATDYIQYHGEEFYPVSMRRAIKKGPSSPSGLKGMHRIVNGETQTHNYTYDEAIDRMARLMYWLSKDLNITFKEDEHRNKGGYGDAKMAYSVLKYILKCDVPKTLKPCVLNEIVSYLTKGYGVLFTGVDRDVDPKGVGHAWVCDGCYYCYANSEKTEYRDIYLHCDFGWGGTDNGYYPADILIKYNFTWDAGGYRFKEMKYMPVK